MNKESYRDLHVSSEKNKFEGFSQEQQRLPFQSPESLNILMNAFNKYRVAVKQHVDPDINSEQSVLLLASLIEKLADSLPNYVDDEPKMNMDLFQKTRKKIFRFKDFFK